MNTGVRGSSKVGIFVDVSNIYLNGGQKLRYDVLRQYAEILGQVQHLNAYAAFDAERARTDREYHDRTMDFYDVLRDLGYHTDVQEVKWYQDPDSDRRYGKANSDMTMAVDLILQSRNLDRAILVTGDGDFVKPVQAVRDIGCRVELIAFDNVSQGLRREVDTYTSGYLLPELIPTNRRETLWGTPGSTVRGLCYYHQPDESFGFMAYLDKISSLTWLTDPRNPDSPYKAVFFHDTGLPEGVNPRSLPSRRIIFEFEIGQTDRGLVASNLRLAGKRAESGPAPESTSGAGNFPKSGKNSTEYTWKSKLIDS
jgi:uncharacterized LabA/DUF88 family protein